MKSLLIHSCEYEALAGSDRDGNKTYSAAVTLQNVRLSPIVFTTAKGTEGETKDDKLTLYYVPSLSTPEITPRELALVTWQDKTYTIRSVTPCYTKDGETVHHYEAALV